MVNQNGTITYEVDVGRSGKTIRTTRGRITPKRVSITTRTWDRSSGKMIGPYYPGMMKTMRLVSYQIDGEPVVIVRGATL